MTDITSTNVAPVTFREPVADIYTDTVQFELSLYGVTLNLGQLRPATLETPVTGSIEVLGRVHMSPQHAKVLALTFMRSILRFETQFGTIAIPEELLTQLEVKDLSEAVYESTAGV